MSKWTEVTDNNVRAVWRCEDEDCDCEKYNCYVDPTFYRENGTPVCFDGQDMDYIRTEIVLESTQ